MNVLANLISHIFPARQAAVAERQPALEAAGLDLSEARRSIGNQLAFVLPKSLQSPVSN